MKSEEEREHQYREILHRECITHLPPTSLFSLPIHSALLTETKMSLYTVSCSLKAKLNEDVWNYMTE
jgi:hypothetical protein